VTHWQVSLASRLYEALPLEQLSELTLRVPGRGGRVGVAPPAGFHPLLEALCELGSPGVGTLTLDFTRAAFMRKEEARIVVGVRVRTRSAGRWF
jgi:hypothetical protein